MAEVQPGEIERIIEAALGRYDKGRDKYGPLDPSTDTRDFLLEMEAELLDCINYAVFEILRLRRMRQCRSTGA